MSGWRTDEPPRDGSAIIGIHPDNSGVLLRFWGVSKDGKDEGWIDGEGVWSDLDPGTRWTPAPEGTIFNRKYAK